MALSFTSSMTEFSPVQASVGGKSGIGSRIIATLISGLLLGALSLGAVWVYAGSRGGAFQSPSQRFRVNDDDIFLVLLAAAAAWFVIGYWIWRGQGWARGLPLGPSLGSLAVAAATLGALPLIDRLVVNEEELLMTALGLVGGALILLCWLPYVREASRRRVLVGVDGVLQLKCPKCHYSMVGLHEARCPECGAVFTLDALILSQPFARRFSAAAFEAAIPSGKAAD